MYIVIMNDQFHCASKPEPWLINHFYPCPVFLGRNHESIKAACYVIVDIANGRSWKIRFNNCLTNFASSIARDLPAHIVRRAWEMATNFHNTRKFFNDCSFWLGCANQHQWNKSATIPRTRVPSPSGRFRQRGSMKYASSPDERLHRWLEALHTEHW